MICDGRVALVTGAGAGIGRSHAIELARQGATVIVNDKGRGSGADSVVAEITAAGGTAVAAHGDVTVTAEAAALVDLAIDRFGRLDAVINNAGVIRQAAIDEMSEADWDDVISVNLRGTWCVTRAAARHWRSLARRDVGGRVICTTSQSGLYGMPGFISYATAKAGVAGFVLAASRELAELGVTVNGIAPRAYTPMVAALGVPAAPRRDDNAFDPSSPDNISPLVAWIASTESAHVTGRVFEIAGGDIAVVDWFGRGPSRNKGARWAAEELAPVIDELLAQAGPIPAVPLPARPQGVFATLPGTQQAP